MKIKTNSWPLCLLSGFGIAFLTALFVISGVHLILFFLESLQLQKQVVVIYTSIFYAIIFLIARIGVRVKTHWQRTSFDKGYLEDEAEDLHEKKPLISRVRNVIWVSLGIYSTLWLTPALAVYWASPIYPNKIIILCSFIFALAGSVIYFIIKENNFSSLIGKLMFFVGACLGATIVSCVFSAITP